MLYFFKHITRATLYSWQGLKAAYKYQRIFPYEILLTIILAPLAILLGETAVEKILLISAVILVLLVELINSAIETVVDRISQDWQELSGRAKDLGSAAVFVAVINAILVWGIILVKNLF